MNQRPILVHAVRNLVKESVAARARLPLAAPERQYYLGVEAAAQELLHPELAYTRAADWPEREAPWFREGYLRTVTMLETAAAMPNAPLRLVMPEPPELTPARRRGTELVEER